MILNNSFIVSSIEKLMNMSCFDKLYFREYFQKIQKDIVYICTFSNGFCGIGKFLRKIIALVCKYNLRLFAKLAINLFTSSIVKSCLSITVQQYLHCEDFITYSITENVIHNQTNGIMEQPYTCGCTVVIDIAVFYSN